MLVLNSYMGIPFLLGKIVFLMHVCYRGRRGFGMEFADVINTRTSTRAYSGRAVEDEKLNYILECARHAPSWANKQCWRFIVVKDKERIAEIAKYSLFNRWIQSAPVVIVACADPGESGKNNDIEYYLVDVGIAVENLVLAATDVHLGSCWVGGFHEKKIKKQLEIPPRIRIIALIPLGYPADKKGIIAKITKTITNADRRKSLEELVHQEHW
jgi:nitroreductase